MKTENLIYDLGPSLVKLTKDD